MSSYFSASFFALLLPVTILLYGIVPKQRRWMVLLAASYAFLLNLSRELIVFTIISTLSVYGIARWIGAVYDKRDQELSQVKRGKRAVREKYKRKARWLLVLAIAINFGILFALKYLGFFGSIINSLAGLFGGELHLGSLGIGAPMGISFYTLMAASYVGDVYRETIKADTHLGRVALYLCFFPQVMEGPLCRYSQTADALMEGRPLTRGNLYEGTLRMAMGFAKKLIVADRLDKFVGTAFDSYATLDGGVIAFAAIVYTLQLYCDFSGTMDVALGMGRIFGVTLPENFKQPFFSKTTSEFWQRWHITLGSWFKDYVFYPVSFSKFCKSLSTKARKRFGRQYGPLLVSSIALFCVWFGNGLWHGAGSQYLLFGMYYFVLIVAGGFVEVWAQGFTQSHGIDRASGPYTTFRVLRTVCLVFMGELLFRAASAQDGLAMLGRIFSAFSLEGLTNGSLLSMGLDAADFAVAGIFIVLVLALDALAEHKMFWLDWVKTRGMATRLALWAFLLALVVIFGAYGYGYLPVDPMYAQF